MQQQGWISIHRKILDNPIIGKPDYLAVWVVLLLLANHKEHTFIWNNKKQICRRGQILTGRKALAEKTGVNEHKIDRILKYLKSEQQIEQQTTTKFRLITINNYDRYQPSEQQIEQQVSNKRATSEQQVSTNNNDNNEKNVINNIYLHYEKEFKTTIRAKTDKRSKKIAARLKVFSLEEIQKAITNYSRSPFHCGKNDRGWKADFDFIMRSDEQIEAGLNLINNKAPQKPIKKLIVDL